LLSVGFEFHLLFAANLYTAVKSGQRWLRIPLKPITLQL